VVIIARVCHIERKMKSESKTCISQGRAARILGVTRPYLNKVIRGKFKSPELLADYKVLIRLNATPNPPTENEGKK
jgi:predicted XRE-type DNA-binding protein